MKISTTSASLLLLTAAGCKSKTLTTNTITNTPESATRSYNGIASVGDFLIIDLDSTAQTLTYSNHSNGDAGTVPYTVTSDGTYTLNDPNGTLIAAYEVPNYALLIQAPKTGPDHNTKALITAVLSSPISLSTMEKPQLQLHAVPHQLRRLRSRQREDRRAGQHRRLQLLAVRRPASAVLAVQHWRLPRQQLSGRFLR
jgi:hypothetical protein